MTRRMTVALAAGLLVMVVTALFLLVALTARGGTRAPAGWLDFGGTDVTERDLSLAEQMRLLNEFAPISVPSGATNIRLRYQRFQDIYFEASFVLEPAEYGDYMRQLVPFPSTLGPAPPTAYKGVTIGSYSSVVVTDPSSYRITISYVAG